MVYTNLARDIAILSFSVYKIQDYVVSYVVSSSMISLSNHSQ